MVLVLLPQLPKRPKMVETQQSTRRQDWNGKGIVGRVDVAPIGEKTVAIKREDIRMKRRSRIAWVVLTKIVADDQGTQIIVRYMVVIRI